MFDGTGCRNVGLDGQVCAVLLIQKNSFGVRAGRGPSSSDAGESCVQNHAVFLNFVNITISYSHSRMFCLLNLSKSK